MHDHHDHGSGFGGGLGHNGHRAPLQWQTPHLERLGAVEISRAEYRRRLVVALPLPSPLA